MILAVHIGIKTEWHKEHTKCLISEYNILQTYRKAAWVNT